MVLGNLPIDWWVERELQVYPRMSDPNAQPLALYQGGVVLYQRLGGGVLYHRFNKGGEVLINKTMTPWYKTAGIKLHQPRFCTRVV